MPLLNTEAPELQVDEWVNTDPVDIENDLVLLDFWNYSCACCKDRVKVLERIQEEYPVEVVGVHVPNFGFEKDADNLETAVESLGVGHPVAVDREGKTSKAYGDSFRPGQVLIEDGEIVWQGTENRGERLEEAVADVVGTEKKEVVNIQENTYRESYLGFKGCSGVNDAGNFRGTRELSAPGNRKLDRVYLDGTWTQEEEFLEAVDGTFYYYFSSSNVGLVADSNDGIRDIEVRLDGQKVPYSLAGEDLRVENNRSYVRVNEPRHYDILDGQISRAEISLEPERKTRLYSLTFKEAEP